MARTKPGAAGPDCALVVLNHGMNPLAGELGIDREYLVVQTGEPVAGADPDRSIARCNQTGDLVAGKPLTGRRFPGYGPDSIKADEAEFSS